VPLNRCARRCYLEAYARRGRADGAPTDGWVGSERDVTIWMQAFSIADEDDVSPWDALLLTVRRRAARVRYVDSVLESAIAAHRKRCADPANDGANLDPDVPPAEVRSWMAESRAEERLLARASKLAVDAGVADAVVRRLELEGRLVTDALLAGLDALQLTPDQRLKALSATHQALAGPVIGADVLPRFDIEGSLDERPDDDVGDDRNDQEHDDDPED